MASYNFKNTGDPLLGSDIKNLYINLIRARVARGMSATAESLVPNYQFQEVTDAAMQTVANEAAKNAEQLNYRYQFPNYKSGDGYAHGNLIYKEWYNQIDVVTKDMARKADCSSSCIGACVATCVTGCQTNCSSGTCGSSCNDNCSSACRSTSCTGSCANTCTYICGASCTGGCTGCGSGCSSDGCTSCTSQCTDCYTTCSRNGCSTSCGKDGCSASCGRDGCTSCISLCGPDGSSVRNSRARMKND